MKQTFFYLVLATLVACSSISVRSDWDRGIDFSRFETFTLLEEGSESINRLIDQRIRAAIVAELKAKGLQPVEEPDQADLAMGFQVTTEERTSFHSVHSGWGVHGYRSHPARWRGAPAGTSRTTQVNFTVGTLVIAAFQTSDKNLVWEGSATGTVDPSRGPEQSERRINDAVRQILRDFPPTTTPTP